jgi:hypothetical protein
MEYRDMTRTCLECGGRYTWPAADQRYHHERGYLPPKRCPRCREAAKQRRGRGATIHSNRPR